MNDRGLHCDAPEDGDGDEWPNPWIFWGATAAVGWIVVAVLLWAAGLWFGWWE